MDFPTALDLAAGRAQDALEQLVPPALMPLPHVPVSAEIWEGDKHVRLHGEAIYAMHRGARAWWAVIVQDSNALAPGCIRMVELAELRCEARTGRRGG
jgi:hypothetical protein